ncbi:WD repeat and HMG-box DNA-binding protein 1-like isoform X3 [Daphnia pulicaria]|uniref:WD repeat and HMG-box DNA-binding protein 1-like isoform X3 n=1 Tax=Daphnia pulicaria TaxID=35523 RepID=UPI001EEA741C|nr:WD repeat and HMG-box DNA-binding protein 1-like isoform X3 [Daphnia pulicaria]
MKRMKFAHVEGHTDLTYSEDGANIITCGADGDYRVWKGYEDDDPECIRVGDEATAIAFKNKKVFVGTDMHVLQIFSHPENQTDGIVTRFTSTITHISVNKDGSKVAAGSGDMTIKVKDIYSSSKAKEIVLTGHTAPILSVSLDPKSEFLASSSCDGTVRVWCLTTSKELKSWRWGPASNDFGNSPSLCRINFEPTTGRYLAVPFFQSSTVKILERSSWKEVAEIVDDRLKDISICCWSTCGKFLATASKAGDILVWDMQTKTVVNSFQHEKKTQICNMAWNPSMTTQKEIAFCDCKGYLGLLENVTAQAEGKAKLSAKVANSLTDIGDDDAEISISQIKKDTGFTTNAEDGQDVFTGVQSYSMDFDILDDGASKINSRPSSPLAGHSRRPYQSSSKKREPFQPGSSPVHLHHRYMVWNNVGIVKCFGEEGDQSASSIEVEFHDSSIHHGLHIPNTLGHTMASLSSQALLLACPAQEDSPSRIVCVNFAAWDGHKEWATTLPLGEGALALAAGDAWVAVATSRNLLRLFSNSGLQRAMISLPGPILCLAGNGSKLFMAYHSSLGMFSEQSIGYALVGIDRKSPIGYEWLANPQTLPLGPECDLSWAGFSDEGTLATMDSSGLLQVQLRSGMWMPLLDTRQNVKGKSDHYFLIGLSELEKCVRCVLCKGARYPPTLPRPNMSLLDVRLPLCDGANEKTQLEEALIQSTLQIQLTGTLDQTGFDVDDPRDKADRLSKESLMKMFALACQAEREVRAVEVAEWMPSEQLLQLAVKYATRARKRQLANRLTEMAEQLVRDREAEETLYMEPTRSSYLSSNASNNTIDDDRDMFISTPPVLEIEGKPKQSDPTSQAAENFCFWSPSGGRCYRRWQIHPAVESEQEKSFRQKDLGRFVFSNAFPSRSGRF